MPRAFDEEPMQPGHEIHQRRFTGPVRPQAADDFTGRILGNDIGRDAVALAKKYWNGTVGDQQ